MSILQSLRVPRVYSGLQHFARRELHTFCDASKEDIGVVMYVKLYTAYGQTDHGFVMGKSKLASHHTIQQLELCAAVLGVEVAEFAAEHLDISTDACYR